MLKSFSGPFVATLFISMFVLIMQFLWRQIDEIVGKGLDFSVIAELLFYASVTLLPMALPLAVLLSSIMTFGNLGENYELIALKSAGISLFRIMRPLIVCVVLLAVFAFFFSRAKTTSCRFCRFSGLAVRRTTGYFPAHVDDTAKTHRASTGMPHSGLYLVGLLFHFHQIRY